ncbi:MAG: hypothetical protein P8182_06715 [Deltaproteobacteria bacterium]
MIEKIKERTIVHAMGEMRAADRERLADFPIRVRRIGLDRPAVKETDIKRIIMTESDPIAIDALIVVS